MRGSSSRATRAKAIAFLRRVFLQCASGATRRKNTYLAAQFRRIASRRGAKKAAIAVAHSILVIISHLLQERTSSRELGETSFEERDRQAVEKRLIRRLERLGYQVDLPPQDQAG